MAQPFSLRVHDLLLMGFLTLGQVKLKAKYPPPPPPGGGASGVAAAAATASGLDQGTDLVSTGSGELGASRGVV